MYKELDNKKNIPKIFENVNIRTEWDNENEDYYWSVIDVIEALTNSPDPAHYWRTLKSRMIKEGNETVTSCVAFKMIAKDGKLRNTDTLNTKGILRLIQSIPSPKAEPFKIWLANVGSDRIDETFDPSLAINRAIIVYKQKGMSDDWIEKRIQGIIHRQQLTETWKAGGINEPIEYAILTNEIYQTWLGMKANEYKAFKGIRKENLRIIWVT